MTLLRSLFISACLWGGYQASALAASPAELLQAKLEQVQLFSADFTQKVFDVDGKPLHTATGAMTVSRPNHFRWKTEQPDESLIISDGNDLWMYDPFVEQVTVLPLAEAIANTPFMLVTRQNSAVWRDYEVTAQGNTFVVTSQVKGNLIKSFTVTFDKAGRIAGFVLHEAQGQRSEFTLAKFNLAPKIQPETFQFKVPAGVTVDQVRD